VFTVGIHLFQREILLMQAFLVVVCCDYSPKVTDFSRGQAYDDNANDAL
jgi:hypothetical protein